MYYNRLIEESIALKLKTSGAVVVAGPKFCGKTTTCMLLWAKKRNVQKRVEDFMV